MLQIAVISDHTQRPITTGIERRRGLGELALKGRIAEVDHFLPGELDRVPANRRNLFLYVDDGLIENRRDDLRREVW